MKEHGLLACGPMVRGFLDGSKTETRRTSSRWARAQPGDRLWVKEAWRRRVVDPSGSGTILPGVVYRADGTTRLRPDADFDEARDRRGVWRSGMLMFRRDTRIVLELGEKRQERLQDIDEAGAVREGMLGVTVDDLVEMAKGSRRKVLEAMGLRRPRTKQPPIDQGIADAGHFWVCSPAQLRFRVVFELLNGPEAWERNELVWVLGGLGRVET